MSFSKATVEVVSDVLGLTKTPVDVTSGIKSGVTGEYMDSFVSGLNAAETFGSMIKKVPGVGTSVAVGTLFYDLNKASNDKTNLGNVSNETVMSLLSDIGACVGLLGVAGAGALGVAALPVVAVGLTASAAFGVAALLQDKDSTEMADAVTDLFGKIQDTANEYGNDLVDYIKQVGGDIADSFDTGIDRFLFLEGADLSEEELEEILNQMSNKKDIIITLEDASANEQEGYISFNISINETLDKDFSFKVQSIDGSATGGSDYEAQNANVVTIKAGSKEIIHKIPIASDGIYEKSEEFMLYAYSQADSYSGYDLGKVTFEGTALGTITDTKAPQSCPAPISPDFGFDFDVLIPNVSASTLFTCKTFPIQKALHVKIQTNQKGEQSGARNKVA